MNPRIIAISGPRKGTVFPLAKEETFIGRELAIDVSFADPSVSRRHCVIRRESPRQRGANEQSQGAPQSLSANSEPSISDIPQFTITDLNSYNGTFVNDRPIGFHPLVHGDYIAIGDVVLLFLLHEIETKPPLPPTLEEARLVTRSTVRLRIEDSIYLSTNPRPVSIGGPKEGVSDRSDGPHIASDLSMLVDISTAINLIRELPELEKKLMQSIVERIPAERAAMLLFDKDLQEVVSVCGWSKVKGFDNSIRGSETITRQVLHENVALLSNDLFTSEEISGRPSLLEARVCSVLCVPLAICEERIGVIYLDTSDVHTEFDHSDLQFLTAIAAMAVAPIENARRIEWLKTENERLQAEINVNHQMIGESSAMRSIYQFIGKVAPTDSTVLIRGESGTGKELAARAIHNNSLRASRPFVAINCATLSETLLESELFGHEKGAFTGAVASKKGKLEVADGGTLFLDEVGELALPIQAKLLRVLQEREFERIGGLKPITVNVRLIAATNKNLEVAVAQNNFRQDLYYRLNVVSLTMPALKNRRDDVQLLANYFAATYSKKCKRRVVGISPEARSLMGAYHWPGNVRELENAIERAVVLGSDEIISAEDLPELIFESVQQPELKSGRYHEAVRRAKVSIVLAAIDEAQGVYTDAAKILGLLPTNLHRLIRDLGLRSKLKDKG